jgi:hypothetical protein
MLCQRGRVLGVWLEPNAAQNQGNVREWEGNAVMRIYRIQQLKSYLRTLDWTPKLSARASRALRAQFIDLAFRISAVLFLAIERLLRVKSGR